MPTLLLLALVLAPYGQALQGQASSPPSEPLIPNVGHNPHLEAPEIFNRELIRFLGSEREVAATER